jgi:hypothetical protein
VTVNFFVVSAGVAVDAGRVEVKAAVVPVSTEFRDAHPKINRLISTIGTHTIVLILAYPSLITSTVMRSTSVAISPQAQIWSIGPDFLDNVSTMSTRCC